ncbi:hypothetical protein SDC9_68990 [bioreactor metagenome]|uniref:Uncharacterized protein n=1 Tax=bioreactor metagenome TaxID=1076179 RepID=A0A644Y1Y2_9ZZZZ
MEIVAHGQIAGHRQRFRVLKHFNEGGEEVVAAVVELLDEGVRVGAAFVAEDVESLMDHLAVQVQLLAEAFHHQLLQIARQQHQPVGIGHDHHVAVALAVAGQIPHGAEHVGGIVAVIGIARPGIHAAGAVEEHPEVDPGQGRGQVADDAGFAGASADRFGHRKNLEPVGGFGMAVEFAAFHGDGAGVVGVVQLARPVGVFEHDQIVFGLLSAAGFGDAELKRGFEVEQRQQIADAGGVGVVQKVDFETVAALFAAHLIPIGAVQRKLEQLRAERRAADAVEHHRVEALAGAAAKFAATDSGGEFLDRVEQRRGPVLGAIGEMSHLAVFIGILDGAGFQRAHFTDCQRKFVLQPGERLFGNIHPAEIDCEAAVGIQHFHRHFHSILMGSTEHFHRLRRAGRPPSPPD